MDDKTQIKPEAEKTETPKPGVHKETKEEALDKREKTLEREERIQAREDDLTARRQLDGQANAGQIPKVETDEEKWAKEAKERYEGTGLDPTPDDTPTIFN